MDQKEEKATTEAKPSELVNESIMDDSNGEEKWESSAGEVQLGGVEISGPVAGTSRAAILGTRGGELQVPTEKITAAAELRKFAGLKGSKPRREVSVVSMVGGASSRNPGQQRKTLAQRKAEVEQFNMVWRAKALKFLVQRKKEEVAQKREPKSDENREADAITKHNEELMQQRRDKMLSLAMEHRRQQAAILRGQLIKKMKKEIQKKKKRVRTR